MSSIYSLSRPPSDRQAIRAVYVGLAKQRSTTLMLLDPRLAQGPWSVARSLWLNDCGTARGVLRPRGEPGEQFLLAPSSRRTVLQPRPGRYGASNRHNLMRRQLSAPPATGLPSSITDLHRSNGARMALRSGVAYRSRRTSGVGASGRITVAPCSPLLPPTSTPARGIHAT